jgi:hypothetical protein
MDFKCTKDVSPLLTTLKISGYVNEHAKFPPVDPTPQIKIDLQGVTGLNSVGTRSWLVWVKNGLPDVPVSVVNAPNLFVKMFGEVQGTLGPRIRVDSFLVPYYSDESGERRDVVFERGKQFDDQGRVTAPEVKDSAGHKMEIDVLPNFFNFLKAQPK